ncbi:MAG: slipin family protein [Bacteroidia bacterium]|nr:slipin family protein [Bacteroidia bacterium]
MKIFNKKYSRIKNLKTFSISRDFSYGVISLLVLTLFVGIGIAVQLRISPLIPTQIVIHLGAIIVVAACLLILIPKWIFIILLSSAIWFILFGLLTIELYALALIGTIGMFFSASIQLITHWDKVVILRMGKFKKVGGSGLLVLMPLIDRIVEFVDTRIRVTDFSAEKTLTSDGVPVHVDALAFWMIWDAKMAILEVENYVEAVVLSAQSALRDAIGKYDLSSLLSEREKLGKKIQKILDEKTNAWGVTILSIEITEIIIPKELEDSLSKQAQAEREKLSRIILAEAEVEIAKQFEIAAKRYKENPTALQLRSMNMIYEGIRQNSSMMLLPASILDHMDLGSVLGATAIQKYEEMKEKTKSLKTGEEE